MHTRVWGVICRWRSIFCIPTWTSYSWILEQWATNMGKGSTRIFLPWRKDMQESCH